MRCCRKEKAMFEATGQITHGTRELGLDAVPSSTRRCCVMGLVDDQQATRQQLTKPFPKRVGIDGIDQKVVGNQKATVSTPWIHAEAALPAHSREVSTV